MTSRTCPKCLTGRGQAALRANHQALPIELVDQIQDAHPAATVRWRTDKVIAPHMVRMHGPEPHTQPIVESQAVSSVALLHWHISSRALQIGHACYLRPI